MPFTLDLSTPGVVAVTASGKLTNADYTEAVPRLEAAIAAGHTRLLLEMVDFHGWDLHAAWDDFMFGMKHVNDITRIAMVGDRAWEGWMAKLWRPFTRAELRYFDHRAMEAARDWIAEGLLATVE